MKRDLICIICPRGCSLSAEISGSDVTVTGHGCKRGLEYAVNECNNPVRTVTGVVRVSNRYNTMVSVKTENPIPKGKMMEVMEQLHKVQVEAPVSIGQVVLSDLFGTNIIVTKAVE